MTTMSPEDAARAAFYDHTNVGQRYLAAIRAAEAAGADPISAEHIAEEIEAEEIEAEEIEAAAAGKRTNCAEPRCFAKTPNDGQRRTLCAYCIGA